MALVAFLKGINVGGHRRLRPGVLARELRPLDVVNIGTAGTFVVRSPVARGELRAEIARRAPVAVEVMICSGNEIGQLVSAHPFDGHAEACDVIRFVGILAKRGQPMAPFPLPTEADWCLQFLECQGRFVLGLHKRQMRAIACLEQLGKVFAAPMTTRSWSTILKIQEVLRLPR